MSNNIKKALISEKSYLLATKGKYSFLVDQDSDKEAIKNKIEKLFGVNVLSVNSANYTGKTKMTRRKSGKRANFKKVILTLKAGQKIDLFELENTEETNKKEKKNKKTEEKTINKATK